VHEHEHEHEQTPRARSTWPLLWCLTAAALFGASTPAAKLLLAGLRPLTLAGVLYLGGALGVAPWALRSDVRARDVGRRNTGLLLGSVLAGGVIGPVALLSALALTSAGSISLWLTLESAATALIARLLFREHLQRSTWIAVALIVAASALLGWSQPNSGIPVVLVVLACVAWGFDNNFTASIDRLSPAQVTFAKGLVAGLINVGAGALLTPSHVPWTAALLALALGALAYGASILLYIRGAQQLGAARSQLAFSTAPAFGLGLSALVLGERVGPLQLAAAVIMAGALWLWHREQHAHAHTHERMQHTHGHRHDDGHHAHLHAHGLAPDGWHSHEHTHEPEQHSHPHWPDLHHRHRH
jgi:drug/metabolite transporter (DMT)-like permease